MRKILFLAPLPPPHYGSATSSDMCRKILQDSGDYEVRSIKLNYTRTIDDVGKLNMSKVLGVFSVRRQIRRALREFRPDIVYMVPATYSLGLVRDSYFARLVKGSWDGRLILHLRSRVLEGDWEKAGPRRRLEGMLAGQQAIVLGKELIPDLHDLVEEAHTHVLPNAIANEVSDRELTEIVRRRSNGECLNLLFLSHMDRAKGWNAVLGACRILGDRGMDFRCEFVGDWLSPKDEEFFRDFVRRNGLEGKVFARGRKVGAEKRRIMEGSDILIFPTEREAFGRVILEAYMFGMPVIASSEGAIPSIVEDGRTGFLLKRNAGDEIADMITTNSRWSDMGARGRKKFLDEFEISGYRERFLDLIRSCAAKVR